MTIEDVGLVFAGIGIVTVMVLSGLGIFSIIAVIAYSMKEDK